MSLKVDWDTPERVYKFGPIARPYYGATESSCTDNTIWRRLMRQWYGLRAVKGWNWREYAYCPHWLIGKRCPERLGHELCSFKHVRAFEYPVWDHARAWRDEDGCRVVTLEPFSNPFDQVNDFEHLQGTLTDIGITTSFEGRSPYGASYILFLMAADTVAGQRARSIHQFTYELMHKRKQMHIDKSAIQTQL
jgi:hypothetical protein